MALLYSTRRSAATETCVTCLAQLIDGLVDLANGAGDLVDVVRRAQEDGVMQDETELHRVAAQLERANGLLSDLIGVLGHDLRAPLAVVSGYLEQLADGWADCTAEK